MASSSATPTATANLFLKMDVNAGIHFTRTDGNSNRRPTKLKSTVEADDPLYMEPVPHGSEKDRSWRDRVGDAIARMAMNRKDAGTVKYHLAAFPDGYQLYENPRKQSAKESDPYLYGSVNAKRPFRSPNEFIFHALWLVRDPEFKKENCECTYCSGTPQTVLSTRLGRRPTESTKAQPPAPEAPHPPTSPAFENLPVPGSKILSPSQQQGCLREHELVWVSIHPTIVGPQDGQVIEFWPGLVKSISNKMHGPRQREAYQISLLGTRHSPMISLTDILPYQAYDIPGPLRYHLEHAIPSAAAIAGPESLRNVNPVRRIIGINPEPDSRTYEQAWPTLCIALRISTILVRFGCLTNPYQSPTAVEDSPDHDGRVRYQGLFWGAERILERDLVRLHVKVQQDPIATGQQRPLTQNLTMSNHAESRGLFMRLDTIYRIEKADNARPSNAGYQFWMAGPVYETVPDGTAASMPAERGSYREERPATREARRATSLGTDLQDLQISTLPPMSIAKAAPDQVDALSGLPEPPNGFKFRPLLSDDEILHAKGRYLAGRYYPRLPNSSLYQQVRESNNVQVHQILSLAGYTPGSMWPMPCQEMVGDRQIRVDNVSLEVEKEALDKWGKHAAVKEERE